MAALSSGQPVEFQYSKTKYGHRRPLVPVLLTSTERVTVGCMAMVDSGADSCVFPLSVAHELGLNPRAMEKRLVIGVGGKPVISHVDLVTVDLGHEILFQTEVGFTDGLNAIATGLLGQAGLFDRFDVSFALRRGVFTVR